MLTNSFLALKSGVAYDFEPRSPTGVFVIIDWTGPSSLTRSATDQAAPEVRRLIAEGPDLTRVSPRTAAHGIMT
jgi:hypothetical protein